MLLNIENAEDLLGTGYPVPEKNSGVVEIWKTDELEIRVQRNPVFQESSAPVVVLWAATAWQDERCLFAVNIEADDLRALAPYMGVSLKQLQADYGVKGFTGTPVIQLYGSGEKESLGTYFGSMNEDAVSPFLIDIVLDTFDEEEEPERIR